VGLRVDAKINHLNILYAITQEEVIKTSKIKKRQN